MILKMAIQPIQPIENVNEQNQNNNVSEQTNNQVEQKESEKRFECPYCHKRFKTKNSLNVHISNYHREEKETKEQTEIESVKVSEAEYSKEDLEKAKAQITQEQETEQEVEQEAKQITEIIENMSEEDGRELYLEIMEILGDLNGLDVYKDIPNIKEKADRRGKHLTYTINKFAPFLVKYIIPIMAIGGIIWDIIDMRRLAQTKKVIKELNEKNINQQNQNNNEVV